MACKEHQTHSRDSHLTFAVLWDPETGLEAYSGCDLLWLRPISSEYDTFPESIYPGSQMDGESVILCDTDEPFFAPGRPKTRFIVPHAPQYTFDLDDTDNDSLEISSKSRSTTFSPSQKEKFPKSLNPPSTSTSLSSKWTFAALWDPKIGLSAFSQGKLAKFIPSTKHRKWPSISTSGSAPDTEHHGCGYIDNIKRGFYLRVLPELGSHSTASSSTFEGHKPHFSCFDPLNEWPLFEPHLHPYPQSASSPANLKKGNHLLGAVPMNDDQVMKSYNFSHAGDPYLPSRFSTSTTSTSEYVPINPTSVQFIPPVTFLGSRFRSPRKTTKLTRSKCTGLQHEKEVRTIPRLFKNVPWWKGSEDDKWVLVEVQSVVTDRVVDGL